MNTNSNLPESGRRGDLVAVSPPATDFPKRMKQEGIFRGPVAAPLRGAFSLAVIVDAAAARFGVPYRTLNIEL